MPSIRCDNCEAALDVSGKADGDKVACPECGDIAIVRMRNSTDSTITTSASLPNTSMPKTSQSAPQTRTANSDAGSANLVVLMPPLAKPAAIGAESSILIVRRAMFKSNPVLYVILWIGVLGGTGGGIFFGITPLFLIGIGLGVLAIACGVALIVWKVSTLGEQLTITTRRTIQRQGLLSKRTSEVLHIHIRNVTVVQSFWNRIMRVGRITISSSADEGDEIIMKDIPNPDTVRETIDRYRGL